MNPKSLLKVFPALLLFASTTWADYYQAWSAGTLELNAPGPFCSLDGGIDVAFNSDGNLVVLSDASHVCWASYKTNPNCNGACQMVFQSDGNLVTYYGSQPLFNTSTTGRGALMAAVNAPPYLLIFDAAGDLVWQAPSRWPVYAIPYCPFKQTQPWRCVA